MTADRTCTRDSRRRDCLHEMLALGREKQEALIGGPLERLDRVIVAEQALLIRMRALEAGPGQREEISVEEGCGAGRALPEEIAALAGELQDQNRLNRRLACQGLEFLQELEGLGPKPPRDLLDYQA